MSKHDILVVKKYASGAEEWFCPTCGRSFIVQWSPEYQCVVLNPGNPAAIHNMSRGALILQAPLSSIDTARLAPWSDYLSSLDVESRLGEENS